MSAKHTPGPWTVENPMGQHLWIVQANLAPYDWTPIATLTEDDSEDAMDRGSSRPISPVERDANAKLIAAAPALLAALQAFIPELEQRERFISANDSPWSQSEKDMLNRIWAARKAVKDAGGEA